MPHVKEAWEFLQRADVARMENKARTKLNQLYYMNLFHFYLDPDGTCVRPDLSLISGMIKVPIFRNLVDRGAASIMAQPSTLRAVQTGGTSDDYYAAQGASLFLREFERTNPVSTANAALARTLLMAGKGFKRLYVDTDLVPIEMPAEALGIYERVKNERNAQKSLPPIRIDRVVPSYNENVRAFVQLPILREMNISPFSVYVENGATNLDECQEFCVHEVRSLSWIQANFPSEASRIKGELISDKHSPTMAGEVGAKRYIHGTGQQTGDSFSAAAKMVHFYDHWKKLPNGAGYHHTMTAGYGMKVVVLEEEVDYHPYIDYSSAPIPDYFWDIALCDSICDLQRILCIQFRDSVLSFQDAVKDIIVVPQGMKNMLHNEYNCIIEENPRVLNSIRRLSMTSGAAQQAMMLADKTEEHMYKAFGFGDASRGVLKSHTTTQGIRLAQAADNNVLARIRDEIDAGERRKGRKILRFCGDPELFDEPRWIATSGNLPGQTIARAVRHSDIGGVTDVEVVDSVELPRDLASRLEYATNLAAAGLIPDIQTLKDFVKLGTNELPEPSVEIIERRRANEINEMILAGVVIPAGMVAQLLGGQQGGQLDPGALVYYGQQPTMNGYNLGEPIIRGIDIQQFHIKELEDAIREGLFSRESRLIAEELLNQRRALAQAEADQARADEIDLLARQSMAQGSAQIASGVATAMAKQAADGPRSVASRPKIPVQKPAAPAAAAGK